MTTRITVSNDGTKTYSVVSDIPLPTGTRVAKAASAAYPELLDMKPGNVIFCSTQDKRNAIMQAFKSKVYEAARGRGKLVSKDLSKYKGTNHEHGFGEAGREFGIWMVPVEAKVEA